jgi:hypothetical protein
VRHDLSAYTGLRTHVEISPDGEQDLEVALLLEFKSPEPKSDTGAGAKNAGPAPLPQTPALPFETGALARALYSAAPLETPADLIALLSREFEKALDAMARDRFTDTATTELANWMLQHWELFAPTAHAERAKLAASTQPHWEAWHTMRNSLRKESAVAMAMMDGSGFDELQLKRGSPKLPLQKVARRGLEAVTGPEPLDCGPGSGRLKFAGQIVSASNPLTARVIVNRVWHHLFGRGIVPSVDNLGVLGQLPSHPELLDTLAVEFIQKHRWSLKSLMRSLVLSSVYQMSSLPADPLAEEKDPENVLLHRMNFRRLESEAIRDAVLTVSGRLDPKLGGPSIPVYLSPFMEGRGRPKSGPLDGEGRRSIYISVVRNFLSPMMLAFDAPIPFSTMGKRNISNVPSQALILMNDPFVVECAKKWAQGLDPKATPEERLRSMYWSAFSREPQRDELKDALLFVQEHAAQLKTPAANDSLVWADLAHVLMTTKEFIHLQ